MRLSQFSLTRRREVQKKAMTTAATAHKHSDRKAANTKGRQKEAQQKKTTGRLTGVRRAKKAISVHLLTRTSLP